MNDASLRDALESLDGERSLDPDRSAEIRAAMLNELDRAADERVAAAVRRSDVRRGRRWTAPAAAAAVVALLIGGLVVLGTRSSAPAVDPEPEEPSLLVACAAFQLSTRVDDRNWPDALTGAVEGGEEEAYRRRLADALDALAETQRSAPFRESLVDAASISRGDDPVVDVRAALVAVEERAQATTGLRCLR